LQLNKGLGLSNHQQPPFLLAKSVELKFNPVRAWLHELT